MYFIKKRMEIAGSHCLKLDYESKCQNLHGHNWIITVYCKSKELNHNGMVMDFTKVKELVMKFDHANLNDFFNFNPTAENMAKYLCDSIPNCYRVEVIESENNEACYERDL